MSQASEQTTVETQHTPGEVEASGNGIHKMISQHYGQCIALTHGDDRHANARRIAALWNEAERMGLSTEAIESGALSEIREALAFYVTICGNTAHSVSRETAQEMYAKGSAALRKAPGKA